MDSMIKKWKKLINNEKTNKNNIEDDQENIKERSNSRKKIKSKDKSRNYAINTSDNDNEDYQNKETNFKNSVISYKQEDKRTNKFKNSIISNHSNNSLSINYNNQSFSQSLNKKIEDKLNNSVQKNFKRRESLSKSKDKNSINKKIEKTNNISLSPSKANFSSNNTEKQSEMLENLNSDKILKLLYKLLNSLPKANMDSFDIKNFSDDLNETINLYIKKINSLKEVKHANEQKEIILQTKCNTAERMIKEYEVKYLTAEKEKVILIFIYINFLIIFYFLYITEKNKYRKLLDDINADLADIKERNEILNKKYLQL